MNDFDHLDWDNVKIFLATMRAPSLRQAAGALKISHPTARRRLQKLEEQLGLQLFDRRPDGVHATAQAVELMGVAEQVEASMHGLGRAALAADPELRGPIRVTLSNMVATDLLWPDLAAFTARWPQIRLEIDATDDVARLDRREADVALRTMRCGVQPPDNLIGRHAAAVYRAVYGKGESWIGWSSEAEDAAWIKDTEFPDLPALSSMNDIMLQRVACAAGHGLALLPCFFAEPMLTRCTEPEHRWDIWVLVHPDLKRSRKLRVFRDAIIAALKRHQPRLEGRSGQFA